MSDPEERENQTGLPPGGFSLGGAASGEYEGSLKPAEPDAGQANAEQLALPRGGLVAFRKSGGLRFSSRGIVVRRSGWVEPLEGTPGRRRHMTDEALRVLERLLLQSGLTRVSHRKRQATPDGYSYEITARVGGRLCQVTLDDPVPAEQERLVRVLNRLLPAV
ncbi:MAG: hypothetical protein OHK0015_10700 [Chloroflexi bacterium OHK40]